MTNAPRVMAPLDGAIQPARVRAAMESYVHLDGPLLRDMTWVGARLETG